MEHSDLYALYDMWGDAETLRYCGGTTRKERITKIIELDREYYALYGNTIFAPIHHYS
jgi:hypothetical protein